MANQPPVRPWFRLASLRPLPTAAPPPAPEARPPPPPAPAPAPPRAPETRPSAALPTFRTSSAPSSPQTQPTQPKPAAPAPEPTAPLQPPRAERVSAPSSPVEKAAITISAYPVKKNGDIRSPKTIKPAAQESPKVKSSSPPPPSPLALPPSKTASETEPPRIPVEAEPKTVLVQKTVEKPKQKVNGEKTTIFRPPKEEKKIEDPASMRVITISGENRGAFMEVIQSPNKPKHLHHKNANSNETKEGYESGKSTTSDSEGGVKNSKSTGKGKTASSRFPMTSFVNSNVQCVNNSLLYNASCSNHDPGVRLTLSRKPLGDWVRGEEQRN